MLYRTRGSAVRHAAMALIVAAALPSFALAKGPPLTMKAARKEERRVAQQQANAPGAAWRIDYYDKCKRLSPRHARCSYGLSVPDTPARGQSYVCNYVIDVRMPVGARHVTSRSRHDGDCYATSPPEPPDVYLPPTRGRAAAVPALSIVKAQKIANHVRHLELQNAFHLRERIGGPFHLSRAGCGQGTAPQRVRCTYDATQIDTDAQGMRTFCTIKVNITRRGLHKTTWRRSLRSCATDYRPAPPA